MLAIPIDESLDAHGTREKQGFFGVVVGQVFWSEKLGFKGLATIGLLLYARGL